MIKKKEEDYLLQKERKKTTYYFKPVGVSVAVQQALRSPLCQDYYKQESAATTATLFPLLPKHLHRGRIISWLISAINLKTEEEAVHIFQVAPVEELVSKQKIFFRDQHIPT